VSDYATDSLVVRTSDLADAMHAGVDHSELVGWLAERGRRTIYTPDTMLSAALPGLFGPHLRATWGHAAGRGAAAWRTRGSSLSSATMLSLFPAGCAVAGAVLAGAGTGDARRVGVLLVGGYGALVAGSAFLSALRFRSAAVGALAGPGLVATQAAYMAGFVRGLVRRA
jgi:hypothetical protein